jgi:hypothetical protein
MKNTHKILVEKSEGKITFERTRRGMDDDAKKYLKEMVFNDVEWIHLAQNRVERRAFVNTVLNHRVPQKASHFFTRRASISSYKILSGDQPCQC